MKKASRLEYIDNLKGVLITLVVIGHFLLPAVDKAPITELLFESIYLFHMPLFVFVSGFLAKNAYTSDRGLRAEKILSFLLIAIVFQAILIVLDFGIDGFATKFLAMSFSGAPWYLVSLACWYMLTPLLAKMKPLSATALSFGVGLFSGCIPGIGHVFAISRTLAFLPFFVAGYYCNKDRLSQIASSKWLLPVAAIGVVFLVCYWLDSGAFFAEQYPLVYGSAPYSGTCVQGVIYRLEVYIVAVLLSLTLLALIPKRHVKVLSYLGRHTLQIYVYHRILRPILAIPGGLYSLSCLNNPVLCPLVLIAVSLLVVAVCVIPRIGVPLNYMAGLKWSWLIKDKST